MAQATRLCKYFGKSKIVAQAMDCLFSKDYQNVPNPATTSASDETAQNSTM